MFYESLGNYNRKTENYAACDADFCSLFLLHTENGRKEAKDGERKRKRERARESLSLS